MNTLIDDRAMKFLKFLIVGGSATALQYGIFILLVHTLNLTPVIATSIAYIISSVFNYLLNYYATFASNASHQKAIAKFSAVACIGLLINSSVVYLLTEMQVHYVVAQVIATIIILIWNFFMHKYWTYKET